MAIEVKEVTGTKGFKDFVNVHTVIEKKKIEPLADINIALQSHPSLIEHKRVYGKR